MSGLSCIVGRRVDGARTGEDIMEGRCCKKASSSMDMDGLLMVRLEMGVLFGGN